MSGQADVTRTGTEPVSGATPSVVARREGRESLIAARKAIYEWAHGDALLLSGRCAKAEEALESRSRLLLEIEGAMLGYWTDIPQAELQRFTARIREALGNYEPRRS